MPNSQDRANAKLLTRAIFSSVNLVISRAAGFEDARLPALKSGRYAASLPELTALARVRKISVGDLIKAAEERIAL